MAGCGLKVGADGCGLKVGGGWLEIGGWGGHVADGWRAEAGG